MHTTGSIRTWPRTALKDNTMCLYQFCNLILCMLFDPAPPPPPAHGPHPHQSRRECCRILRLQPQIKCSAEVHFRCTICPNAHICTNCTLYALYPEVQKPKFSLLPALASLPCCTQKHLWGKAYLQTSLTTDGQMADCLSAYLVDLSWNLRDWWWGCTDYLLFHFCLQYLLIINGPRTRF